MGVVVSKCVVWTCDQEMIAPSEDQGTRQRQTKQSDTNLLHPRPQHYRRDERNHKDDDGDERFLPCSYADVQVRMRTTMRNQNCEAH